MKKVIVTRENYEEIMFDLLENQYERDVRENILDQIHADTFLSFEWQQWSKAVYSESTEIYKATEAEFIESLTKEEKKKKGLVYYLKPMAIAASIILLIGTYFIFRPSGQLSPGIAGAGTQVVPEKTPDQSNGSQQETPAVAELKEPAVKSERLKPMVDNRSRAQDITPVQADVPLVQPETINVVQVVEKRPETTGFRDTINSMIASARKKNRYKVTVVEERSELQQQNDYQLEEKRYSMADVMNHKDGISLSKFLQNPNSRIITDKETNKVMIEYIAEDHSILVLTLSN
jgi:hypothetical protein